MAQLCYCRGVMYIPFAKFHYPIGCAYKRNCRLVETRRTLRETQRRVGRGPDPKENTGYMTLYMYNAMTMYHNYKKHYNRIQCTKKHPSPQKSPSRGRTIPSIKTYQSSLSNCSKRQSVGGSTLLRPKCYRNNGV